MTFYIFVTKNSSKKIAKKSPLQKLPEILHIMWQIYERHTYTFYLYRSIFLRKEQLQKGLEDCSNDLSQEGLAQLQELASGSIGDEFVEFFKAGKTSKGYPSNLKKFFVTLHLKSPTAYRYVREIFQVCYWS